MNILLFPLPKSKFCFEQMAEDFLGGCSRVTGGGEENNFESISNFPGGWPKCVWRQVSDMQTDEKLSSSDVKLSDYKGSSWINT